MRGDFLMTTRPFKNFAATAFIYESIAKYSANNNGPPFDRRVDVKSAFRVYSSNAWPQRAEILHNLTPGTDDDDDDKRA